jgi:hypothetical protein
MQVFASWALDFTSALKDTILFKRNSTSTYESKLMVRDTVRRYLGGSERAADQTPPSTNSISADLMDERLVEKPH